MEDGDTVTVHTAAVLWGGVSQAERVAAMKWTGVIIISKRKHWQGVLRAEDAN